MRAGNSYCAGWVPTISWKAVASTVASTEHEEDTMFSIAVAQITLPGSNLEYPRG